MDQPLGFAVGNNLEVKEAINTLKGHGPKDLFNLCVNSGSIMLTQAKLFKTTEEAKEAILENVKNGKAFEKFVEFVKAQKGDTSYILNPDKFEMAKNIVPIYSDKEGVIKRIDALTIGKCAMKLGGGREVITDVIDMSAGIVLNKKIGDKVEKGELLCTLYTNKNEYSEILNETKNAFIF